MAKSTRAKAPKKSTSKKTSTSRRTAKKGSAKKSATKRSAAKKPAAKKGTPRRSSAKKPEAKKSTSRRKKPMTCAVAAQKLQGGSKAAGRKLAKCSGTAKPKKARAWKTADHRVQVGLVRASSDRAASLKRLGFKGKATGRFFSLKASSGREAADLVVKALKVIGA